MRPANVTHDAPLSARGTVVLPTPPTPTAIPGAARRTVRPATKAKTERGEILAVLSRAARDPSYIAHLTYNPCEALQGYNLSQPARAALASGDVRWIEARVGALDDRMRTWLDCRLQQEIW